MKSIYQLIMGLWTCFFWVACSNDLTINPSDQYSENTFWKSSEEAMAALTGCYRVLQDGAGSTWFLETDMITPNGLAYNESNGTDAIARGVHNSLTGLIVSRWEVAYRGIGRTNTFLSKISDVAMDEQLKSRTLGEAKFLRGLYYFYLVDCFGGVPLIVSAPDPETQSQQPRNTKEEVVAQMLQDLAEAAEVLPATYTAAADQGRATRGAALALRARILLYNERWREAAEEAKKVMDLGVYSLFDNYRALFMLENEENQEVIFNVSYQLPRFPNNFDHDIFMLNRPAPTKDLVDAYLMKDGEPITTSTQFNPARPYENRDPRLLQTVNCIGYPYNGQITTPGRVVTTGFGLKKYTSYPDNETIAIVSPNSSQINPILIRYAEVLLTYAEAQNEASGPDASVYTALNSLRQRPSVAMPTVEAGLDQEGMREVIRRERRVELAFEGIYYSDIKRWRIAEKVNNGPVYNHEGAVVSQRTFDAGRDYLWPIPADQVQLNPTLEQNPNWY
ncbi:RagB/SusD family nutrient uptake outer membrane protein [Olivibacter domesticus]|uniref:Starch-binding associating with outer membrane n=1 Tax=Olivibacter domesticus TaxID=407022 RepID=A0A1H7ZE38_OLID1|nr:RagB/SusD family nutrient uptake outer membrane protein [Olivibacter domesticus]SEM56802.1 Starch-binding associating with outer membrane [Olivibacter domesticus]